VQLTQNFVLIVQVQLTQGCKVQLTQGCNLHKGAKCNLHTRCSFHTHCVEACLVTSASTYTRERIYATHMLVAVLRGSALCASTSTSDHIHAALYISVVIVNIMVCDIYNKSSWTNVCEWGWDVCPCVWCDSAVTQ